jgi:hypothetical protein
MKKKEAKEAWILLHSEGVYSQDYFFTEAAALANACPGDIAIKFVGSYEIDVPEPSVEVTPSMIDEMFDQVCKDKSAVSFDELKIHFKKKLFGSGNAESEG